MSLNNTTKRISAFRYAKENGYRVFKNLKDLKEYSMWGFNYYEDFLSKANKDYSGGMVWLKNRVVLLNNMPSQLEANLALWHEIGHTETWERLGDRCYSEVPIVKLEAMASIEAAKKVSKYGFNYSGAIRTLRRWYNTYATKENYREYERNSFRLFVVCNTYL